MRFLVTSLLCGAAVCHGHAYGHAIFAGFSSTEQTLQVPNADIEMNPTGERLFVSLDINDNWSINGDYSDLNDSASVLNNQVSVHYELESKGIGISYFADQWRLSYQFSDFSDLQQVTPRATQASQTIGANNANAHSLAFSYFLTLSDHWDLTLGTALNFNDWQEDRLRPPPDPGRPPLRTSEEGDALLLSVSGNLVRFSQLNEHLRLTMGTSVSWNQVIDDNAELDNINGRPVNQIRGPGRGNINNALLAAGNENYGLATLYLSFDIYQNWVLDLDTSIDFGTDINTHAWSINLGYLF